MRLRSVFIWIFILTAIDQIIKWVIRESYMDTEFPILPPFLYFLPKLNTEGPYWLTLFSISWSNAIYLAIYILIIVLSIAFLIQKHKSHRNILSVHLAALFIIAAGICVSIDNIFYGGSLDYIYLKPLFIFDLKDMYVNCAVCFILYFAHFYESKKKDIQKSENHS